MTEHTPLPEELPLPWRVSTTDFNYAERRPGEMASIMSAETDEWFIASMLNVPHWEQAAQHIVSAVNSHPTLLASIRELEGSLRETTDMLEAALRQSQAFGISLAVNAEARIIANRAALADR